MNRCSLLVLTLLLTMSVGGAATRAHAHSPWLATDDQGHALLFFGEDPTERTYKLPDSLAEAKVSARVGEEEPAAIELETREEDDFIGRRSVEPVAEDAVLEMTYEYGLYHGTLLTYYVKHLPGDDAGLWKKAGASKSLKLDIVPTATDDGLTLRITWEGAPRQGAEVTLTDSEGERHDAKTDANGDASFEKIPAGPVGAAVNIVEDIKGDFDGKEYRNVANFATLIFHHQKKAAPADASADSSASALPRLPEPLASFGPAVSDGHLYVYGGHIGTEHDHSRDNLSQHFRRLALADGAAWEEMPMQTPLQGLPLVGHGGKLYRVGGLSARNAAGDDEDLHSVAEVAAFDPQTNEWTELPPLPEARSSHDAAAIGDVLYVVGGWTLTGSNAGRWLDTAWAFDLGKPGDGWQPLPSPSFRRRALAVAEWQGKLVALGGMDEDKKISRDVHVLDRESGRWTKLATLPGKRMDGFGVSACSVDGALYASGTQDSLYRLSDDGAEWEAVGELEQPRFFHRLVPGKDSSLLAVAGASVDGHLATIERLAPRP